MEERRGRGQRWEFVATTTAVEADNVATVVVEAVFIVLFGIDDRCV